MVRVRGGASELEVKGAERDLETKFREARVGRGPGWVWLRAAPTGRR